MKTYTFTTSGTTGKPKRFTVDEDFMQARVDARIVAHGDSLKDVKSMFCDVGINTTMGVTYRLLATKVGMKLIEKPKDSVADTMAFCETENIDAIVSTVSGIYNYALAGGHKFKTVIYGGAALDLKRLDTIQNDLGTDVINLYASSEVGSISMATADQMRAVPGCVGVLCPDVEVEFDDRLMKIKTPTMITGYDDPALNAVYFKDGWFVPGDKGYMTDDHLLVLDPRFSR